MKQQFEKWPFLERLQLLDLRWFSSVKVAECLNVLYGKVEGNAVKFSAVNTEDENSDILAESNLSETELSDTYIGSKIFQLY